jgi:hypothetical protein
MADTNAYQNFLDFFSRRDKERLDGLNEGYFSGMTPNERNQAFEYLRRLVEAGGGRESIHGLFIADWERATTVLTRLLKEHRFQGEAEVIAAWNVYRVERDRSLLEIFIRAMSSDDKRVRQAAAYYVPADTVTLELLAALKHMIRVETDRLAAIHAVNALLACYDVSKESIGAKPYREIYLGLRAADSTAKEAAFRQLDALYA